MKEKERKCDATKPNGQHGESRMTTGENTARGQRTNTQHNTKRHENTLAGKRTHQNKLTKKKMTQKIDLQQVKKIKILRSKNEQAFRNKREWRKKSKQEKNGETY